jgi:hypothetical protein
VTASNEVCVEVGLLDDAAIDDMTARFAAAFDDVYAAAITGKRRQ